MSETAPSDPAAGGSLPELLDRLEDLLAYVDELAPETRDRVFELLDGVDAVHRLGLTRLAAGLDEADLDRVRRADPAVDWLFAAYGVGVDDLEAASVVLDQIRPYIHDHGGEVEVLAVRDGRVRVRLTGACAGCTGSSITVQEGVEEALRTGLPGFAGLEVETDDSAAPHPPPGPVLVQIQSRPA
jgi:Fe-S cluster biogenesis protein NfuA